MPFALIFIGLILIVSGAKDTYRQLGNQLVGDFTGQGNFTYWVAALIVVGSVGYIKPFQNVSRLFLALIIITMVIRNGGVFDKFSQFLKTGPVAPNSEAAAASTATVTGQQSGLSPQQISEYANLATAFG